MTAPLKFLTLDQLGKISCVSEVVHDERLTWERQNTVNDDGIVRFDRAALLALLHRPLPWKEKLVGLIAALSPEARNELAALMWIGRGDGDADDFEMFAADAGRLNNDPIEQARYIAGKAPLAEYLHEGLKELSSPGARARARIREMADVSGDC